MRGLIIGCIVYVVAGFLTFGYVINESNAHLVDAKCDDSAYISTDPSRPRWSCIAMNASSQIDAVMAGAFWPIYWGGKGAIEVTR